MVFEMDENGNAIDFLAKRNQEIRDNIRPEWAKILAEKKSEMFPKKLGNMITNLIFAELEKYPMMTAKDYNAIDSETLQYYFQSYLEFISHFVTYEISTTKPLFCQYMRITVDDFLAMLNTTEDEELKRYARHIDDVISGLAFSQAETGNVNAKAVLKRAQIKDIGQGMVETSPETNISVELTENPKLAFDRVQEHRRIMAEKLAALKKPKNS